MMVAQLILSATALSFTSAFIPPLRRGLRTPYFSSLRFASSETDTKIDPSNRNNIDDQLLSCLSSNGQIKVTTITSRNLLNDLMLIHLTTKQTTNALGQAINCALMMASGIQEEQTVQLNFKCEGPIRNIMAIASGSGGVRGYCGNPRVSLPTTLEVVGATGGVVQVVKMHPEWKNPYNGITEMRTGEIDRDVGLYLAESEQRSVALAASVVSDGYLCRAAGGYLVEQLPGADEETIKTVETNLAKLFDERDDDGGGDGGGGGGDKESNEDNRIPGNLLLGGKTPIDIAEIILDGLGCNVLDSRTPKLTCDCNSDRLVKALRLLPRDDVDDIIKSQERIEAKCEFCGTVYRMEPEEARKQLEEVSRKANEAEEKE